MFRVANCNDLLQLKKKYPTCHFTGVLSWTLKQLGTLYCYDYLNALPGGRVLEVGAGANTFFDNRLPAHLDYWMMDKIGYYDEAFFKAGVPGRSRTTHVQALLGDGTYQIPDNHFDAIFSVSVLEHVPPDQIKNVAREMHRLLKPGGVSIHSLDWAHKHYDPMPFYEAFRSSRFKIGKPNLEVRLGGGQPTMLEPLEIIATMYGGVRARGQERTYVHAHASTVLVNAQK